VAVQRTIWVNFKGSVSNLMASTKAANNMIGRLGAGVVNVGKNLLSALGGNFQPLLKSVTSGITSFAKVLTLLPSFLLALVSPTNVVSMAMTRFSDAISATSPEEFLAATRNMAPAMRDGVMAVRLLEPQLKNLYGLIQQGFWAGFTDDINNLARIYFPVLDQGLGSLGTTLGQLRHDFMAWLAQPEVVATIQTWISSFGDWAKSMLPIIENMLPTLISLFKSMMQIMVDLLPILNILAGWFAKILGFIAPILSGIAGVANAAGGVLGGTSGGSTGGTTSGGGFWSNLWSGVTGFFSHLFGRAGGGSVLGGQSYLVGERGPEILSMGGSSSGQVSPNAGGATHVHVKIGDQELRDIVSHEIRRYTEGVAMASRMGRGLLV
jgi:hypothetical protein